MELPLTTQVVVVVQVCGRGHQRHAASCTVIVVVKWRWPSTLLRRLLNGEVMVVVNIVVIVIGTVHIVVRRLHGGVAVLSTLSRWSR